MIACVVAEICSILSTDSSNVKPSMQLVGEYRLAHIPCTDRDQRILVEESFYSV